MARVGDEPIIPMDLGNMRANGVRSLNVMCAKCRHETFVNVDQYPDHLMVPSFAARMVCTACGHAGADVRPNWLEHRPPRRLLWANSGHRGLCLRHRIWDSFGGVTKAARRNLNAPLVRGHYPCNCN